MRKLRYMIDLLCTNTAEYWKALKDGIGTKLVESNSKCFLFFLVQFTQHVSRILRYRQENSSPLLVCAAFMSSIIPF